MIKRLVIMSFIVLFLGITTVVWLKASSTTTLAEPVVINQQEGEFILHMRIENGSEGFNVLHSLEYVGEEPVTIEHRTPMTFLSFGASNSDFTGSPISKTLQPGDIYRTKAKSKIYEKTSEGSDKIYVHCQFIADGEEINMNIEQELSVR